MTPAILETLGCLNDRTDETEFQVTVWKPETDECLPAIPFDDVEAATAYIKELKKSDLKGWKVTLSFKILETADL